MSESAILVQQVTGTHKLSSFQSLVEIGALTACAAATGVSFYSIDKCAGLIFVPYLAWLSFASYLNYAFYKLNTPAIEEGDKIE